MRYNLAALALVMLSFGVVLGADDKTYPIILHRPFKKGDLFDVRYQMDGQRVGTAKTGETPTTMEYPYNIDIEGRLEVLAVDARGEDIRDSIIVKNFSAGPEKKSVTAAGDVLTISRSTTESTFTLRSGSTLDDSTRRALVKLIGPVSSSMTSVDDEFGSKVARKLGESWPVNSEMIAKAKLDNKFLIDPKNIVGTVTLIGVETVHGIKAFRLNVNLEMKDIKPAVEPEGRTRDSVGKQTASFLYPLDDSIPFLECDENNDHSLREAYAAKPGVVTDVLITETLHLKCTFLPVKKP